MSEKYSIKKLVLLGVIASFFFSSTFVINRWISVEGGNWYWTASLRYYYVFILFILLIIGNKGVDFFKECIRCFIENWFFWIIAGGIGYGCFYLALCFASSFAPGWVIATTWQLTILASPIVLYFFGKKVPLHGILFLLLIFTGICLVNFGQYSGISFKIILSIIPVLFAAFCYPLGNNLCKYAVEGRYKKFPINNYPELKNTFSQVFLMTFGAIPILILVGVFLHPALPTKGQLFSTFYVAITTGVIATSLFYKARQNAQNAYAIAAVDATQAGEVLFALIIEIFLFHGKTPSIIELIGIIFVVCGIIFFTVKNAIKSSG